jgi:4-phytase / acid phosphatase
MIRLVLAIGALLVAATAADAQPPRLERMVLVIRHGIRPPTHPNADIAKYAAQAWPDWSVPPGELTPHGGETVRLMGETLRAVGVEDHLLPASGCSRPGEASVWADGTDQRTRRTGEILAAALEPGCTLPVGWAPPEPRDPIFAGTDAGACHIDTAAARAALQAAAAAAAAPQSQALAAATEELQSILAPDACRGGSGVCFRHAAGAAAGSGGVIFPMTASLAEDLYLEYAEGKPMSEVGWGRASRADLDEVMRIHEAAFEGISGDLYLATHRAASMARDVLDALAGYPVVGGPQSGPGLKLLAFSGHDTNLAWMGALFGLQWTLPGQPSATAPSTVLAFELWVRDGHQYVLPVVYYETLDQMRTLTPARAEHVTLHFKDCASGPKGSCPLATLRQRVLAELPPGCGEAPAPEPAAAPRP